jgi:3,4-dihydroxy 2-butanone 4-phosphate synthase/GTP cyclohydrolase II
MIELVETNIKIKRKEYIFNAVFKIIKDIKTNYEHIIIIKGDINGKKNVYTRIHSECITGDLFGSTHCDCGQQLDSAYKIINTANCGIIIYLKGHEGRGIGLVEKMKAYNLQQNEGLNTIEANIKLGYKDDLRNYDIIPDILNYLNIKSINLLTNNPLKITALKNYIKTVTNIPAEITEENFKYLQTKKNICNHNIKTFNMDNY